jgi:type II secretory pathway predicted ATPase ExeA
MYEAYFGFVEKPFSLTPDPKYLYRSPSHADAFELLQYAIERREGFVVVTGDIGTGKTTLCRALLEQIERTTVTALLLNPFLSEDDLLKRILQDFGVVRPEEVKRGRLAGATKQELIDTLYDFLLALIPKNVSAVLIIDEAQNLPPSVLEQIRILSNLETDKEKLLQIILVGQLNLQTLLRTPDMRQLDQRVSIRYELKPLDGEGVAAYVAHRLRIAGGSAHVTFTPQALESVYRLSRGIPRLINLICDRALLAGFSERTNRITPDLVLHAATSLDLPSGHSSRLAWLVGRGTTAAAAVILLASTLAVGGGAWLYALFAGPTAQAASQSSGVHGPQPPSTMDRRLPAGTRLTILVGTYPMGGPGADAAVQSMTEWLEASGFRVYYDDVEMRTGGRWRRVLAGAYTVQDAASADAARLMRAAPGVDMRILAVVESAATAGTAGRLSEPAKRRAGIEP